MRILLSAALLLLIIAPAHAAVKMAVSQSSGAAVTERARQLARQLGSETGTPVEVVELPDAGQVEAWLNRYATAELALVESSFLSGKAGQFVTIGPVGGGLVLIGRQGISGDLPQRAGRIIEGKGERPVVRAATVQAGVPPKPVEQAAPVVRPATAEVDFGKSKSESEDRYFVTYVYREKFGRDPEPERLVYWTRQLRSGVLSKQQLFEQICQQGLALCKKQ